MGLAVPAAGDKRLVEHAREAGRGVGDDLGRMGEALGILESRDGGVDLARCVGARSHTRTADPDAAIPADDTWRVAPAARAQRKSRRASARPAR